MKASPAYRRRSFPLLVVSLVLTIGLVACGATSGGTPSSPAPTSSTSSTGVTPTPATSPTAPAQLVTYRGNGFTIGYPQGWVVTQQTNGSVTFTLPPRQTAKFLINVTKNAHGTVTPAKTVELGLQLFAQHATKYRQVAIAPTATIGGVTWSQAAAIGDLTIGNASQPVTTKVIVLATNHPQAAATTNTVMISYQTKAEHFDAMDKAYFQPMLQSFTFI